MYELQVADFNIIPNLFMHPAKIIFVLFLVFSGFKIFGQDIVPKRRVLILTDIENEPDDTQSMIRFLTYSNHWDVEGLIATTSIHQQKKLRRKKSNS